MRHSKTTCTGSTIRLTGSSFYGRSSTVTLPRTVPPVRGNPYIGTTPTIVLILMLIGRIQRRFSGQWGECKRRASDMPTETSRRHLPNAAIFVVCASSVPAKKRIENATISNRTISRPPAPPADLPLRKRPTARSNTDPRKIDKKNTRTPTPLIYLL